MGARLPHSDSSKRDFLRTPHPVIEGGKSTSYRSLESSFIESPVALNQQGEQDPIDPIPRIESEIDRGLEKG